ncbi:MAG: hypothetical protein AAB479_03265 [Patescibacteria group bacterium]
MPLHRLTIYVGGAVLSLCFVLTWCLAIMLHMQGGIGAFYGLMSIGVLSLGGGFWWAGFEAGKRIYGKA